MASITTRSIRRAGGGGRGSVWAVLFAGAWVLPPPTTDGAMRRLLAALSLVPAAAASGIVGLVA